MQSNSLQSRVITARFTLPVSITITLLCWAAVYFLFPDIQEEDTTYEFWKLITDFPIPIWANKAICLIIYFGIGYSLIQMNNAFGLIRARASIQTSFYFLLIAACPAMQMLKPGDLATLAFVIALYLLFGTYQSLRSSGYLFHAFLFIGLGSLVFPQITLFVPILLIGAFSFQSLTIRSLCAAIIGWSLPYWFLFGHAFWYDNMDLFYQPFIELSTFYPININHFQYWEMAVLGYSFILFLSSSIHCLAKSFKDKIRTRVYMRFLILLNLCTFLFIILQPVHCANLLPLLFVGVSILTCHMFVLTKSRASNIFFICTNLALIALFLFNVWTLL